MIPFDYDRALDEHEDRDGDEPPTAPGGCGTPGCRGECCVFSSDGSERGGE